MLFSEKDYLFTSVPAGKLYANEQVLLNTVSWVANTKLLQLYKLHTLDKRKNDSVSESWVQWLRATPRCLRIITSHHAYSYTFTRLHIIDGRNQVCEKMRKDMMVEPSCQGILSL